MPAAPLPTLYTFKRCPYAIRARLALHLANIPVQYCEIDLKNKPASFVAISPKATVPVLVLTDQTIIDESLDIVDYACQQASYLSLPLEQQSIYNTMLTALHDAFIPALNRLKYTDRYDNVDIPLEQQKIKTHCSDLNQKLQNQPYLFGHQPTKADIVFLPFVRQLHIADNSLLTCWQLDALKDWLTRLTESPAFLAIMKTTSNVK